MTGAKPNLLWVSDACVSTGFARVTHNVLGWLGTRWNRSVLGVNASGDPHSYPYPIYPARVGGDFWGFGRFAELIKRERADVVVIQTDAWLVESFVEIAEQIDNCPPIIGFMPVDGRGMKRSTAEKISKLALAIFYTKFGEEQARGAGFTGESTAIGLGVRPELYSPCSPEERAAARAKLLPGVPSDAFVIGNVNRNQPRKRLDLSIGIFSDFLRRGGDGVLYLHCLQEDIGWDLQEVAHYYGVADRLFMPKAKTHEDLWPESVMRSVYSIFDVQITTTVGEGWGLPTLEGMACGVPQIVPDWAALGEWARGAVRYVPVHPGECNFGYKSFGIGAAPDREAFVEALLDAWRRPEARQALAAAGMELAAEPRFRWGEIAKQFDACLNRVIGEANEIAA